MFNHIIFFIGLGVTWNVTENKNIDIILKGLCEFNNVYNNTKFQTTARLL
jgi:hypothetical protein